MGMSLGDFFSTAPHARPVNAKPVTFTAICKDKTILPGGARNPSRRQVAATVKGCFEFVGDGLSDARRDARSYLRDKGATVDPKTKLPQWQAIDDGDFLIELQFQLLFRALRQYDNKDQTAGDALFVSVDQVRELVEQKECNRLWREYFAYVDEEHPEAIDDATFRETEG